MKRMTAMAVALTLAACAGGLPRSNMAVYDLGSPASAGSAVPLVGRIEVASPSWLAATAMQYRLPDGVAQERRVFAESRWIAPPHELIEATLKHHLLGGDVQGRQHCLLRVEIDEFVQVFDAGGGSVARWSGRVVLQPRHGGAPLARRGYALSEPAGGDARSGVAAFARLEHRFAQEIGLWLEQVGRDSRPVRDACRA